MFRLSRATDERSVLIRRLSCASLLTYLDKLKERMVNAESNIFNRSSKQCRLLVVAMEKVGLWLSKWEITSTRSRPFVLDLLSLAAKGVRLLEDCKQVTPSTRLAIAAAKTDSKEEFLDIFQRFLLALNGYVEVMQGLVSVRSSPFSPSKQRCISEARSVIVALDKDLHFLSLQAAEDQRGLFESLERVLSFKDREQTNVARFLMHRLEDGQKHTSALQMDSPHIILRDQLGNGAYGDVYKATWMGKDVAVKQYIYQASLDAELRGLLKTSHVNIMRVIGYTPEVRNKRSCLIMECMEGDLSHFVERLKVKEAELPLSISVEILLQIASGMAHLHSKEIVHRDLKPENILFDRWPPMSAQDLLDGPGYFTAKITDFGDSRPDMFHTTNATACRGTASYRAPEVLQEESNSTARYSNKVDVFSFGMVAYKLLTRLDPCLSRDKALAWDFTDLKFPQRCPPAMIFFIRRCWARDHERPSFSEIFNFLSLFKSILLNRIPMVSGIEPPLFQGINDDLLGKLVAFLGIEWLIESALSLNIKLKFKEGMHRLEVDEVLLRQQVREHLDVSNGGDNSRWLCWCWYMALKLFSL